MACYSGDTLPNEKISLKIGKINLDQKVMRLALESKGQIRVLCTSYEANSESCAAEISKNKLWVKRAMYDYPLASAELTLENGNGLKGEWVCSFNKSNSSKVSVDEIGKKIKQTLDAIKKFKDCTSSGNKMTYDACQKKFPVSKFTDGEMLVVYQQAFTHKSKDAVEVANLLRSKDYVIQDCKSECSTPEAFFKSLGCIK
jgi:hypothetical protein